MVSQEIEIKKTIMKDGIYICQADVMFLLLKMKQSSLSLSCRATLQTAIDMLADANNMVPIKP